MTYTATFSTRNPAPGVMTFTIKVDPSMVIITIFFVLSMSGSREENV